MGSGDGWSEGGGKWRRLYLKKEKLTKFIKKKPWTYYGIECFSRHHWWPAHVSSPFTGRARRHAPLAGSSPLAMSSWRWCIHTTTLAEVGAAWAPSSEVCGFRVCGLRWLQQHRGRFPSRPSPHGWSWGSSSHTLISGACLWESEAKTGLCLPPAASKENNHNNNTTAANWRANRFHAPTHPIFT